MMTIDEFLCPPVFHPCSTRNTQAWGGRGLYRCGRRGVDLELPKRGGLRRGEPAEALAAPRTGNTGDGRPVETRERRAAVG